MIPRVGAYSKGGLPHGTKGDYHMVRRVREYRILNIRVFVHSSRFFYRILYSVKEATRIDEHTNVF